MQNSLPANWRIRTFSCHDTMPFRQDTVWLLKRGAVKTLTWSEEGTIMTLGYWGAGDVVGQSLSQIQPYQIKCLTRTEASCIPLQQWNCIFDAMHRSLQQIEALLYIVRSERIHQRLLKILIWLAQKFGRDVEQGQLIELRITHQDLAEFAGTTRVTVTKLLNQFEQEGIIARPHRHSIIVRSLFIADATTRNSA
ncbi:MAG: Crp/Fnr family transcriptional regulator, partial [Microcystaceae cyanobacterium]